MAILLAAACSGKPLDRSTPVSAFGRLGPCLDQASTQCMMRELDRDSRWSLHTIHRTLKDMRSIVDSEYPEDRRDDSLIFGIWKEESTASTPEEMFDIFCSRQDCMRTLARGFGAVTRTEHKTPEQVILHTVRDSSFSMTAIDGEWGLSTFRDLLLRDKLRLGDNLEQIKQNAKAFQEQRRATGQTEPHTSLQKETPE